MEINIEDIIAFEDNHLMIVIKPQNIPCQGDETKDDNLLDMLKNYIKKRDSKPGNVFLGLVHRLDRPTGGLMIYAKTSKCASRISEQIRNGTFEKQYLAVVRGEPENKLGHLENYLKKDETTNTVQVVPQLTSDAKLAVLDYELLQSVGQISLLKIQLGTGRGHQIRVQLAFIGHGIVADQKYGQPYANADMALWAYKIKFDHPVTKQKMCFICEPPKQEPWIHFDMNMFIRN